MIPRYNKFPRPYRVFLGWTWEKYNGSPRAEPVDLYYSVKDKIVATTNKRYGGSSWIVEAAVKRFPRYAEQITFIHEMTK